MFVAEHQGALLGFLALKRADHCLDQLFIAPNAKRIGIGRSLFSFAKTAMPNGFWLRTAADNKEACAFYEAVGMASDRIELIRGTATTVTYGSLVLKSRNLSPMPSQLGRQAP